MFVWLYIFQRYQVILPVFRSLCKGGKGSKSAFERIALSLMPHIFCKGKISNAKKKKKR